MDQLNPYSHFGDTEQADHAARPEARQGSSYGDVDDYIFAGEPWRPSER